MKILTKWEGEIDYVEKVTTETINVETKTLTRSDGKIDFRPEIFYPDLWEKTQAIDKLLNSFGGHPLQKLWRFLRAKTIFNYRRMWETMRRRTGRPAWPRIEDYADEFSRHGTIAWGACGHKAHLASTLLARLGFPLDSMAVASCRYRETPARHVYLAVKISGKWYYLDPLSIYRKLPQITSFRSIGGYSKADYEHPFRLRLLPNPDGSKPKIDSVPVLEK